MSKYADYVFSKKSGETYKELLQSESGRDKIRWQLEQDYLKDTSKKWKVGLVKWLKEQLNLFVNDVSTNNTPPPKEATTNVFDVTGVLSRLNSIEAKVDMLLAGIHKPPLPVVEEKTMTDEEVQKSWEEAENE